MAYRIRIAEPGRASRDVDIAETTEIGRQAQLTIEDPSVSRRHVRLTPRAEGLVAEDLGSRYGTKANGHPMDGPVLLSAGDQLQLGDTVVAVLAEVPDPTSGAPPPAPPAPDPASPTAPPGGLVGDLAGAPGPPAPPAGASTQPVQGHEAATPPATPPAAGSPDAPVGPSGAVIPRPTLDEMVSIDADGAAVIRYRRGTAGERAAKSVATAVKRARKRLEGFGSEPWGVVPQVCLVDPFPDPADPAASVVSSGTIVDAARQEIWMVVTPEVPPEPAERALTLLFGASLPAGADLEPILEGYGLWLAKAESVDDQLATLDLPPLALAEGELRSAMALSFVNYLIGREKEAGLRRFLGTAQSGRADTAAQEIYGVGLTNLELNWREVLAQGGPKLKTGQFLRLSLRYLRPHKLRQAEIFVYMLFSLAFVTVFPFVTRALFDGPLNPESETSGNFNDVAKLLGALGIAVVISLVAGLRQAYLTAYISGAVVRDIRKEMFEKLQTLSTGWYRRHQAGDVLTRLFSDVAIVEQGLTQTLREGLFQVLSLIVSSIVMLTISPLMGIIVLIGAPLVAVVYRVMANGAQRRGLAVQEDTGALTGVAAENYQAEPVVKLFSLQRREGERFGRLSERLFRSERRLNLFGGLFGLSVNLIVTILRLGVLGLGAWLILNGSFTLGGLVAFLGVMGEVLAPVTVLTGIGQEIQQASGALHRINEVLDEEPELVVKPDAGVLPRLTTEIRLDHLDFSYTSERQVLNDVNAVIPAGKRVAFVGASGSGKSTIFQLLMRLYDPDGGAILFDGHDIRDMSVESLRGQLGVVFQDNFLFDTTVRENIAMGKAGATDAEIEAAAKAAEVHEFITQLPRGYDTVVGERGGMLSGGQRQRVAIARALVRNPQVLLLDEATSALDPKTERQIIATLNAISEGRTTVAITHRLTSVSDYDLIFVIQEGRVVESGDHDELTRRGGVYARLWSEQTGQVVSVEEDTLDPVPVLGLLPMFAGLGDDELGGIAARLRAVELPPGQAVGDGDGRLAIIAQGRARVLTPTRAGEYNVVAELGPGDAFGVSALLSGPVGARLQAVDTTRLLVLEDGIIAGLAARYPSVAAALEGAPLLAGDGAAGPRGGQRLTRMTIGVGGPNINGVIQREAAGVVAGGVEPVRRSTGSFNLPR